MAEIEATLSRLVSKNERGATVDELRAEVKQLLPVLRRMDATRCAIGTRLYRVTTYHPSVPQSIRDIWFPPADKAELARANRTGTPMFYACTDKGAALCEAAVDIDRLMVVATWEVTAPLVLPRVGYSRIALAALRANRKLPETDLSLEQELDERAQQVQDELFLLFTSDGPTLSLYPLTVAIAEELMNGPFHGICYPTVARQANGDNLALLPSVVPPHLRLIEAEAVRVESVRRRTDAHGLRIGGRTVGVLTHVSRDGILYWREGPEPRPDELNQSVT